jgi:hypothetical protein
MFGINYYRTVKARRKYRCISREEYEAEHEYNKAPMIMIMIMIETISGNA